MWNFFYHLYLEHKNLVNEPWRKTDGWGKSVREELKQQVAQLAPECRGDMNRPSLRVVLMGTIKAGKSSVINSLKSVYKDNVVSEASVGELATSLTKKFRVYEIKKGGTPLPWKICDTMGLRSGSDDQDVKNILSAVDGHVPDGHDFTKENFRQGRKGFISDPAIANVNKAHCIAVVIAADTFVHMGDEMKAKLRNLRMELIDREIPTFIILTKVDMVCDVVKRDVTKVYRSIAVRDLVSQVSKMLHGLPKNQIFPVVNYKEQIMMDENMDILLLYAVRQMLYSAQAYLEEHKDI